MTEKQLDSATPDKAGEKAAARVDLQRQQALLKAGALQSAILNSANFAIIATDEQGTIQLFNRGAEAMLGYASTEMVNLLTPTHISDPLEAIARAVVMSRELATPIAPGFEALVFKAARGIEDIYEQTYIRKDGSRMPAIVSVTALRDAAAAIIGYLLIGTDNSARKQAEEQLRRTEESFRLMVESVTDCAIVMLDPDGLVVSWNSGAQRIKGYTAEEIVGQHFSHFYPRAEVERGAPQRHLDAASATLRFEDEGWRVRKDGSAFWAKVVLTAIRDQAGNPRGFAKLTRDLSERRRLEAELTDTRSASVQASLAQSNFLSTMSQELRTPLSAMLGFAQLMETDSPGPTPTQKENIAQILQSGWYLMELVDEVLDLAAIESGRPEWSRDPMSLAEVMLECRTTVEALAHRRGVRLNFPDIDGHCFIKADRTRVKQVLINLLSNAVKYNQVGGSVEVQCSAASPQRIRVSVRDSGAGLTPEQLTRLFEPFNHAVRETRAEPGTGIGLVATKRIVELMGGAIGVQSTLGEGSLFWIELVTAAAPERAVGTAQPTLPAQLADATPSRTLLYVEDNPANLQLVEQIVARRPEIRLLTARTAILGIECARAELPDVVLMDINLPGMSGIEAMQMLRADAATAHIPVVALSANAIPRDIERGLQAGFFRYLTKPFKVAEFLATLDAAFEIARHEVRASA